VTQADPDPERDPSEGALYFESVSKAFGATQALDGASFRTRRGEVHALLGGNGSGKSTLIKILAGVIQADAARIGLPGGSAVAAAEMTPARARAAGLRFVHQQQARFDDLTVAENLALGHGYELGAGGRIRWKALAARTRAVLARFEIDAEPGQLFGTLRPAAQAMVMIARALQDQEGAHEGVLVLDEPTATLPRHEVDFLLSSLRRYAEAGQTILYVTHRLDEVVRVADSITVLRDGRPVVTCEAAGITHDRLVELIVGRVLAPPARVGRLQDARRALLRVRDLAGETLRAVDFDVADGEIVGLAGAGCSTLLRLLFGDLSPDGGTIELDDRVLARHTPARAMRAGIAYVPENRGAHAAFPDLTVAENLSVAALSQYWRAGRLQLRRERADASDLLRGYSIRAAGIDAPLRSLSGGNQQKVMLARWLRRDPRVLLLDEPTQGVDVGARLEIYALIRAAAERGTAILLVSSDLEELAVLCHRVLVLGDGHVREQLQGTEIDPDSLQEAIYRQRSEETGWTR
jgi:ribose transport system ATP-binding protein